MPALGRIALIDRLRRQNDLVVCPILSSVQFGPASIDLRMGNVLLMVRARGASHVEPALAKWREQQTKGDDASASREASAYEKERDLRQKHERYELPFGTRFLLHPGSLALVPTLEWIGVPADLIGTVTARSTWAREGLSIATATLIEPNYRGIVTLELANLGQIPIAIYPGLRIAQIAFFTVEGDTKQPNPSQFRYSFEPLHGELAKPDEFPFLPNRHWT